MIAERPEQKNFEELTTPWTRPKELNIQSQRAVESDG